MPDKVAGRRGLEFFGLLAIGVNTPKKQRKDGLAPQPKKSTVADRPRKGK